MTQDEIRWSNDAIDMCERAKAKGVLVLIRKDGTETSEDEKPHHIVVTNAKSPEELKWLARAVNGEVGSGDDEDSDG